MFDALYIYDYYQRRDERAVYVRCSELGDVLPLDIHGDQKFVPVEFAGAMTTVLFYVSVNAPCTKFVCQS